MCSPLHAGYSLLCISLVSCLFSFIAPFWIYYINVHREISDVNDIRDSGLWLAPSKGLLANCGPNLKCRWVWEDNFQDEKNLQGWEQQTQGLFAGGLLVLIIGWFITMFRVCCHCCIDSRALPPFLGLLALLASTLIASSVVWYGIKTHEENGTKFYNSNIIYFGAFYSGALGALLALIASILFFSECCCSQSHAGYHMTRVV